MTMLRSNKESLLIVLEAFVYDPIISWGIINERGKDANAGQPNVYL